MKYHSKPISVRIQQKTLSKILKLSKSFGEFSVNFWQVVGDSYLNK